MKNHGLWQTIRIRKALEFRGKTLDDVNSVRVEKYEHWNRVKYPYRGIDLIGRCAVRYFGIYKKQFTVKHWNKLIQVIGKRADLNTTSINQLKVSCARNYPLEAVEWRVKIHGCKDRFYFNKEDANKRLQSLKDARIARLWSEYQQLEELKKAVNFINKEVLHKKAKGYTNEQRNNCANNYVRIAGNACAVDGWSAEWNNQRAAGQDSN